MSRYSAIIEGIFTSKFQPGMRMVDFAREEFETVPPEEVTKQDLETYRQRTAD